MYVEDFASYVVEKMLRIRMGWKFVQPIHGASLR
jgi:hypothetical protein